MGISVEVKRSLLPSSNLSKNEFVAALARSSAWTVTHELILRESGMNSPFLRIAEPLIRHGD